MATTRKRSVHKHYRLDPVKIKRAQKILRASTETETIERALDTVIDVDTQNRLVREAHDRFGASGIEIEDAYGKA